MPRDDSAPALRVFDPVHWGEVPKTRFLDWLDAITVDLVNWPDRERLWDTLAGTQSAAWAESVEDLTRVRDMFKAEYIAQGKSLPITAEVATFTFRIGGISRTMTHQIVRNRLGVVFSQKGTATQDVRHQDVLVPRSLNRPSEADLLEEYIGLHLDFKDFYARSLDTQKHSMTAIRYAMPHSLSQFIFMTINLEALRGLVGKRLCTCEAIEYNRIAELMVERVREVFPEFASMLRASCDTPAGCYYQKAFGTPINYTLHFPDAKHDMGPWNSASYIHKATRDEMMEGPTFVTRQYVGRERVRVL